MCCDAEMTRPGERKKHPIVGRCDAVSAIHRWDFLLILHSCFHFERTSGIHTVHMMCIYVQVNIECNFFLSLNPTLFTFCSISGESYNWKLLPMPDMVHFSLILLPYFTGIFSYQNRIHMIKRMHDDDVNGEQKTTS